jgi:hypothetical protein
VSISLSLSNVMLLGLQNEQFLFCWYSSNGFFFFFYCFCLISVQVKQLRNLKTVLK